MLVQGAWHGGWCWRDVADALRAQGHRVFTLTQTGLGERRHLLSHDVTLDVFVDDAANLVEAEELCDAILVGHSFGGSAISGVADRMPGAVRHLVHLHSLTVEPGLSPFGMLPPDVVAARRKQIAERGGGVAIPPSPPTRPPGRRVGGAAAHPAPGRHLREPAPPEEPRRQRPAAHLHRLHRAGLRAPGGVAAVGGAPGRLGLAGDRHRPRRDGGGAGRTGAYAARHRVALETAVSSRPGREASPWMMPCGC
ncbi:alpha/beta fold hydrolase [Craurococcus roseus]|uniref:alpha/beta fold hydrolase n=1 Tax=Craurococcus roseus TaxID=77585 RepID=UPI0038CF93C6